MSSTTTVIGCPAGDLVLVGVAALVVVATCYVIARVVRRVPVNRLIALVAVAPTLVWTSHGVWNVTVNALGMSPAIAAPGAGPRCGRSPRTVLVGPGAAGGRLTPDAPEGARQAHPLRH